MRGSLPAGIRTDNLPAEFEMTLDLKLLGTKLHRYREQFQLSVDEVSGSIGIPADRLADFEKGEVKPSGDEVLILADFYKCDYRFFVSNERLAAFEQTETLFRKYKNDLGKSDRWAIQEFLFLADNEHFLQLSLERESPSLFSFEKRGTFYKAHGEQAAEELRKFLGYSDNEIPRDVYSDFRRIGIHVFRRKLENSRVSGLCIKHPVAGSCVLVNYLEDVYRQRFTAAHEAAHAILDIEEDVIMATEWNKRELSEIRANVFASHYLMPRAFLRAIPSRTWTSDVEVLKWANTMRVSTTALAYALSDADLITRDTEKSIKGLRVPRKSKVDPEVPTSLTRRQRERRLQLITRGLSSYYVDLCVDAYAHNVISAARLGEVLLAESDRDLSSLLTTFGARTFHGD